MKPETLSPLELFEVAGGEARPLEYTDPVAFLGATGHAYPQGNEVVLVGSRRMAFYTKGTVRAWPLGAAVAARPGEFVEEDLRALLGSYMTYQLRKALTPEEQGWPMYALVTLGCVGVVALLVVVDLFFGFKVWDILRGLV